MTLLLLDTTFVIDTERSGDRLDELIGDDDDVAIAAVTVAELGVGALLASGRRRRDRTAFVEDVVATVPVLDYDRRVAESHAQLLIEVRKQGKPRGAHHLIIAATAQTYGRVVVTADVSAFQDLPGVSVRTHR